MKRLRKIWCWMQGHDLVGVKLPPGWSRQTCKCCGEEIDAYQSESNPYHDE